MRALRMERPIFASRALRFLVERAIPGSTGRERASVIERHDARPAGGALELTYATLEVREIAGRREVLLARILDRNQRRSRCAIVLDSALVEVLQSD